MYTLKIYPRMMIITDTDWHAVEDAGRWAIYDNNTIVTYADNVAIAKAKLMDYVEASYGIVIDD